MAGNVYKVVYCSKNLMSGDEQAREAEIEQILERSRQNNRKVDVSGALLFSSGYFAQVLEGPQPAIENLFERIQRDLRHGDVTVLESMTGDRRDFAEWSMAYVQAPTAVEASAIEAKLQEAMQVTTKSGERVLDLLKTLVLQEEE